MNNVIKEAKRLYGLGFAIHWVHPRSKRPVNSGWTTGARAPWPELASTYVQGYNVGVRTGSASKIGEYYLACIDVDIKDKSFLKKAAGILGGLTSGAASLPEVMSGSGNGSRHLYCVTRQPFKMITVKKDKTGEVCIYSNGRQMVLPPSVHPSGVLYKWHTPLTKASDLPLLDFLQVTQACGETEKLAPHLPIISDNEVEIEWLSISQEMKDAITVGTGVTDRSDYLFRAARALYSAGCDRDEILSILTNPALFLGKCAYDHVKSNSRVKAMQWLLRYTVSKVEAERSVDGVFTPVTDADIAASTVIAGSALKEQTQEMEEGLWRSKDNGFYEQGKKGALIPDYGELFRFFSDTYPYKMIADMKSVFVFNGIHYTEFTPYEIRSFAEKHFSPKPTERMRGEFFAKVLANNISKRNFFVDSTEGKLNFKNGVLDLAAADCALQEHSPDFGFRGVLPYEYDPRAKCPLFWEWINSVMLSDLALVKILQEYMGYIIRGGDYKFHKALWLDGTGRNGKSTFIDILKALIGPDNYCTISIKNLVSDRFAGAALDGQLANFSEETSPQELADSGPFKNLTGDGDIFAQKKFGDPYSFRNRAKLVMSYNTVPDLKDLSPGMLSRPLIVPFRKHLEEHEQDHDLKSKLLSELPGIFNFALKGWHRLEKQNRFTTSLLSENALQKVKEESCSAFQWIQNFVDFNENTENVFTSSDLYTAYRGRERFPYNMIKFCRRINEHPEIKKRQKHTRENRGYWGLKIR